MYLCGSVIDTVRDILGGWSMGDVIAVIVISVLALLIGFLIGALIFRRVGYNKGRVKGERDTSAYAKKKAKEEASGRIEQVMRVAREKQAAMQAEQEANRAELREAQEKLRQAEESRAEAERSREEAERSRDEAESFRAEAAQAVLKAARETEAATQAVLQAEREKAAATQAVLQAEREKAAAAQAAQQAEREKDAAAQAAQQAERERIEAAAQAEREKEAAAQALLAAENSKKEAEQKAREAEDRILSAEQKAIEAENRILSITESETVAVPVAKERKEKIDLLTKEEILAFAAELDEHLPASIYTRGGEELPDSCRVGICTFLLVYQRKNMVKLVLRLPKGTAEALQKRYNLFTRAVYPKGDDWYKWILSSEVTDLDAVTAAVRAAYKYVFLSNYDERTGEVNVAYANRDEIRINEEILKYKDLPDRDFIVASDAADGRKAAYRLYGKKEMADYARSLGDRYPVSVTESDGDLTPSICRVANKTFLMAYEKDGVAKMIFRLSDEDFARVKEKHPTAEISSFPKAKGYHWYVAYIDATFTSDADIENIIRSACAYMCERYGAS